MKLKEVVWGAPDGKVLSIVNNRTISTHKPFYYHVITMSSHEPFIFVKPYYSTKKFNTIPDETVKNYFTCISYVDSVVAKFVADVQHARPNTLIMIYGDHTPAIKNNRNYTQAALKDNGLYFEFVPLIIITPEKARHFEKNKAVSFLDIAPTALEKSNMPFKVSSLGENLLQPDSLNGKIPYRGVKFTREELYKKINDLYVKSNNFPLR
jgi:phosphoglycerol transferase MdoB-like AlkP superfamily enzyme